MGLAGRLEGIAPSDIFQIISQGRMTGTLIARCSDRTAMVVFKSGQVIEAASDAPQETLGHLLVSEGLISESTIEAAGKRRMLEPERPLGDILVQMGAISEKTLETVVYRQIGRIIHRLMSCDDGFITFDRGEMAVKRKLNTREFFLPTGVSPEFLIMERARVMDEERRSGADRRHTPGTERPAGRWDGIERRSAPQQERTPGAPGRPASWFRAFWLQTAATVRHARETVLRRSSRTVRSAADLVRGTGIASLRAFPAKVRSFSPDGKAMIVLSSAGIAAATLILLLALSFRPPVSELLVTGRIVNIRAHPEIAAKIVVKAEQGDIVAPLSYSNGWHEVRTRSGESGWVWKSLVEQKERPGRISGKAIVGGGFVFISACAMLAVGILRKRKTPGSHPGPAR